MRYYLLPFLLLCIAQQINAQKRSFSGQITDDSGEALPGISVRAVCDGIPTGVWQTDAYGKFSFLLNTTAQNTITLSGPGCTQEISLGTLKRDTFVNWTMHCSTDLQAVNIVSSPKTYDNLSGVYRLNKDNILQTPTLGGEPDLLKSLALLPGVTNGIEGSSGLYIRGGSPDQNLILLDDAPVFNISHLFGFLSIFNSDIIKDVVFYKGNAPARFGGRLSSVLDIHTVEGNQKSIKGSVGIGLFDSKVNLDGPLWHNRVRFSASARTSYIDLFTLHQKKRFESGQKDSYSNMNFYDVNGKINFNINKNNQFFVSIYKGKDQFDFWDQNFPYSQNKQNMNWGNTTVSARLHSVFKSRFYVKNTLVHSAFHSGFHQQEQRTIFDQQGNTNISGQTAIRNESLKSDLTFSPYGQQVLRLGLEANYRTFTPRKFDFLSFQGTEDTTNVHFFSKDTTFDASFWIEDEIRFSHKLTLNAGGRITWFQQPSRNGAIAFDPRLIGAYVLNNKITLRADYGIYHQNINLLSNNSVGLPLDIWTPTDKNTPVQRSWQTSLGVEFKPSAAFTISNDCYFRKMKHLTDLRTGVNLLLTPKDWDELIEKNGTGTAFGDEIYVRYRYKTWHGNMAYTWSKNTRSFQNIDNGETFYGKFDQRNRISIDLGGNLSRKWRFALAWVYNSGIATTLPVVSYEGPPGASNNVLVFPKRNNARFPAYHRGDLSLTRTVTTHKGRQKRLSFGAYNFYNQRNVYFLTYKNTFTVENGVVTNRQLQIIERNLFPIIPSVTYAVTW